MHVVDSAENIATFTSQQMLETVGNDFENEIKNLNQVS